MHELLRDITFSIAAAWLLGLIAQQFRQPILLAYPVVRFAAGVEQARVLISTVPDSILKGTTNERLVRMLRGLNPKAKIIATAEVLDQVDSLLGADADYVSLARLREASDLLEAVRAAAEDLLEEKRTASKRTLQDRAEVLA